MGTGIHSRVLFGRGFGTGFGARFPEISTITHLAHSGVHMCWAATHGPQQPCATWAAERLRSHRLGGWSQARWVTLFTGVGEAEVGVSAGIQAAMSREHREH